MKKLNVKLLLAAIVFTTSFGYAQEIAKPQTDTIRTPIVYLGNIESGSGQYTKEKVLKNLFLTAKSANENVEWEVVSFRIVVVQNGKEYAPIAVTGNQFPERLKSQIQSARSDIILEIAEIQVQSNTGETRMTKPILIRVSEKIK